MAQRRMFSKTIIESDLFLDMSLSAQALYFHLGVQADDDGFVSPNRIVRMIGSQVDDLKILIAKRFLIPFENGVVVIRHWKENNYIQKDRKKDTIYLENLAKLSFENGNVYTLDTKCIQNVHVGKDSIGKVRKEKDSASLMHATQFDIFWNEWPVKKNKKKAKEKFLRLSSSLVEKIMTAVEKQKTTKQWKEGFIPHAVTWLNQERWEDKIDIAEIETEEETKIKEAKELVNQCVAKFGEEIGLNAAFHRFSSKYGLDEAMKLKGIFKE